MVCPDLRNAFPAGILPLPCHHAQSMLVADKPWPTNVSLPQHLPEIDFLSHIVKDMFYPDAFAVQLKRAQCHPELLSIFSALSGIPRELPARQAVLCVYQNQFFCWDLMV